MIKEKRKAKKYTQENLEKILTVDCDEWLGEAAAIARALNVHAENLLSCGPTAPRGR